MLLAVTVIDDAFESPPLAKKPAAERLPLPQSESLFTISRKASS